MRTKIRADQLYRKLRDRGMNVRALHGDMSQGQRDGVMLSFKGGRVPILVATDVAARGLDISTVTHVVNFDVPICPDVYVHRIGRTGRVGRTGRAITFIEPRQGRELEAIERHIGTSVTPVGGGRQDRPGEGRGAPAPALQAVDLPRPRRAAGQAHRRRRARPTASRSPTSSTRSPAPPGSTARPSATSASSSASRSSRCRAARPSASSQPSTARPSTARRSASRWRVPRRAPRRSARPGRGPGSAGTSCPTGRGSPRRCRTGDPRAPR